MRIIVPMAGMGKRLRPHTLITPKPLFPIAGKPIVHRLVADIARLYDGPIDEIAFIIGDFGPQVEHELREVANALGTTAAIYHQDEALGTAHAIYCAEPSLDDELIIAFADTLFIADFKLDRSKDGVIWVNQVDDPRAFGVVTVNDAGIIDGMVEKPDEPVSNLAIIGIYYIKNGTALKGEIKHLLDNNITAKGEYQLTDALDALRSKGAQFVPGEVKHWMDCGKHSAVIDTNERILAHYGGNERERADLQLREATIIEPCYIGSNVRIERAVVGPHVSLGDGAEIVNSVISNSIIMQGASVHNKVLHQAVIGRHAQAKAHPSGTSLGDFSVL